MALGNNQGLLLHETGKGKFALKKEKQGQGAAFLHLSAVVFVSFFFFFSSRFSVYMRICSHSSQAIPVDRRRLDTGGEAITNRTKAATIERD